MRFVLAVALCPLATGLVHQDVVQTRSSLTEIAQAFDRNLQGQTKQFPQGLLHQGKEMFANKSVIDMVRNSWDHWEQNSKVFSYDGEAMAKDGEELIPGAHNVVSLLQSMSDSNLHDELNRTDSQAMRMLKAFQSDAMARLAKNPIYEIEGTNVNLQYGTYPKCNPGPLSKFYVNGNKGPLLCYRFGHTFEDGMELYWNTYDLVKYGFGISIPKNYPMIPNTQCSDHRPIFFMGLYPNLDWKPKGGFQHPRPSFKYSMNWIFDNLEGHHRPRFSHDWVQYSKYSDTVNPQTQEMASDIEVWFTQGWWGLEGHAWDCTQTLGWKSFWCNNEYFLEPDN